VIISVQRYFLVFSADAQIASQFFVLLLKFFDGLVH
jgi:hypothetical protein